MTMMQYRQVRCIGLDVHKATIAVAIADEVGTPSSYGSIANDPGAVRKLMPRLGGPDIELRVAYAAGPTGYALYRQLAGLNIACLVVAPSLVPKRPGDKVKTDRRDALKLARLLRSGDLTPIWVPDEAHEALRNLVRTRADAKADQRRRARTRWLHLGRRPTGPGGTRRGMNHLVDGAGRGRGWQRLPSTLVGSMWSRPTLLVRWTPR
jgi:transposase